MSEHIVGDDGSGVVCPMPCPTCDELGPGGCEDCIACLVWPEAPPTRTVAFPERPGPRTPTMTGALRAARDQLDLAARVGLVSRRYRRQHGLSQRGLAEVIGWSQPTINRAESSAGRLSLLRLEDFLRRLGYRLAIVPVDAPTASALGEEPDEAWGVPDLVARDTARRRLPPHGQLTWHDQIDRRLAAGPRGHESAWTWQRPG